MDDLYIPQEDVASIATAAKLLDLELPDPLASKMKNAAEN